MVAVVAVDRLLEKLVMAEQVEGAEHALFVYRWPTTGYRVQGFASEDVVEDHHVYEPVTCLACRQIHHVNPTTGAVLGKKAK
jgi:hypothetical protein